MQTQKSGSVVFVSSIAGYTAIEGLGVFLFFYFFVHLYLSHPSLATRPSKAVVLFFFFNMLLLSVAEKRVCGVCLILLTLHDMYTTKRMYIRKKIEKKICTSVCLISLTLHDMYTCTHTNKENEHIYENRK